MKTQEERMGYKEPTRSLLKEWIAGGAAISGCNYSIPNRGFLSLLGKMLGSDWKSDDLAFKMSKAAEAIAQWDDMVYTGYKKLPPGTRARVEARCARSPHMDVVVRALLTPPQLELHCRLMPSAWVPPIWCDETWFKSSAYFYTHQLHMAVEKGADKGNVAYAETVEKGLARRYTSTRPGRYLTRFFGPNSANPVLTEENIKKWVERVAAHGESLQLQFIAGNDPKGWRRVYSSGPASCMRGEDSVRVYAHEKSVLRLAYCEVAGEVKTRCIVREDTKKWLRCYPNPNGGEANLWHTRMVEALEAAGYIRGSLIGVHLNAVPYDDGKSYGGDSKYVMPYVDSGTCDGPMGRLTSDGRILVCNDHDGVDLQTQEGYVDFDDDMHISCDECGDRMDEDDSTYIETEEINVCSHCYENSFCQAIGRRGHEVSIRTDNCTEVGGQWYVDDYMEANGIFRCAYNEEYYQQDDLVGTKEGLVNGDDAVSLDEPDDEGNDYAYPGDTVETHDRRTIHKDDAVEEEVNDVTLVFHKDDDIEAYKAEHAEEKEEA